MGRVIVAMVLCITALGGCIQAPTWTLFYYADQQTIPVGAKVPYMAGYYQELEQCLAKGSGMVTLSSSGKGSFECGFKCQDNGSGDIECQRFEQAPDL